MKLKNRLMLDLLKEEVEVLKDEEPELDPSLLDKLLSNVSIDVRKDDLWGIPMNEAANTPQALNQDWEQLPREYSAFVEAGLRALSRLGDSLRSHSPA